MIVQLTREPIDDGRLVAAVNRPGNGGICTFYGVVRDNLDGRPVVKLEYEAFEPMALAKLREITAEVRQRWGIADVALVHRIGEVQVGEPSVVIAVGAPHREEAFAACRHIIDTLKTRVPIWKKEFFEDGAVWVEPVPGQSGD
jgi:molybdopterin synthase catalytic subunit